MTKIERTVDRINSKVDNLETNVKHIEARVASVEQSASFMNDQYESTKQNLPIQASKELINSAKKWNLLLMS